jgi:hypothetical protein
MLPSCILAIKGLEEEEDNSVIEGKWVLLSALSGAGGKLCSICGACRLRFPWAGSLPLTQIGGEE